MNPNMQWKARLGRACALMAALTDPSRRWSMNEDLRSRMRLELPYFFERIDGSRQAEEDGQQVRWCLVNRDYMPFGDRRPGAKHWDSLLREDVLTAPWLPPSAHDGEPGKVDYNANQYAGACLTGCMPALVKHRVVIRQGRRIMFDDGCPPWASKRDAKRYLERLEVLQTLTLAAPVVVA